MNGDMTEANAKKPDDFSRVHVWEGEIELYTYGIGPEDPNPPFRHSGWDIYPYTMLDDLSGEKGQKSYKAVFLENEYLLVTILPGLNGRIYSIRDKIRDCEVLYRNSVVKPGLLALRGAWISGGIEFNFPQGHSVTTVSPVSYRTCENDDGSATVFVGDLERIFRMKWTVGITLRPGRSFVETRIWLCNRTPIPHPHYFWANAAVTARKKMRFIYPMFASTVGGSVVSFPFHNGVDLSWYVNHHKPVDLFAIGDQGDFFGCYDYDDDRGVIHFGSHRECPGKKFFTWGNSEEELMWMEILSDGDGPYCELQSGLFRDQSTHEIITPHTVECWTDYWWGIGGTGGFSLANRDAALKLERNDRVASIAAASTLRLDDVEIKLSHKDGDIFSKHISISPEKPFRAEVEYPVGCGDLTLALRLPGGSEIISYADPPPWRVERSKPSIPPAPTADPVTPEGLCLAGFHEEKARQYERAESFYLRALEADDLFTPALNAMGFIAYRRGLLQEAKIYLEKTLSRSPADPDAHYLLGLIHKLWGNVKESSDHFWKLSGTPGYSSRSYYFLSELAFRKGDFKRSLEFADKSCSVNPNDTKAFILMAIASRKLGKMEDARNLIEKILRIDPLDLQAPVELAFIDGKDNITEAVPDSFHYVLELAIDYGNLGLYDEAVAILRSFIGTESGDPEIYPLVYYYLGYYLKKVGLAGESEVFYRYGSQADSCHVFPNRIESYFVLRDVLGNQPNDAKAHYYLANLLYSWKRPDEAIQEWEKSLELGFKYSVLYRNLGFAFWKRNELDRAVDFYRKASQYAPEDYKLYLELENVMKGKVEKPESRLDLFLNSPGSIQARGDVAERMIKLHLDLDNHDDAIGLLESRSFSPWEGAYGLRSLYVDAYCSRGCKLYVAGRYAEALSDFERALEYPRNIGIGKPYHPSDARPLYLAGVACGALGLDDRARGYFESAAEEVHDRPSELWYYEAMAKLKLGRNTEATIRLRELLDEVDKRLHDGGGSHAESYYLAGLGWLGLGNRDLANDMFGRALAIDPGHRSARRKFFLENF